MTSTRGRSGCVESWRTGSARSLLPACPTTWSRRTSLRFGRSEEHTSELQSQSNLVCRLLLEKKKKRPLDPRLKQTMTYSVYKSFAQLVVSDAHALRIQSLPALDHTTHTDFHNSFLLHERTAP